MKKIAASLLTVLLAGTSLSALAVPVRATFDGTVTGSTGFFTNVLNDVPVGTTASFDLTFDDAGIVPTLPVTISISRPYPDTCASARWSGF